LDWLADQQDGIEARLAARHLTDGGLVLFDVSSSWVTGRCCPLAAFGYSGDARRDHPQITYGLLTAAAGRPIASRVFPGNTADPTAFTEIPALLRDRFALSNMVIVGDRGMLTTARIDALNSVGGFGWVTALRAPQVAALAAEDGPLQLSLFDQHNLAEITHPDYPAERLICCRNPNMATDRARKRSELLDATDTALGRVQARVQARRLVDPVKIGLRVGKIVARHKMAKHFTLDIGPGRFTYRRDQQSINTEAALDGIYVLRTPLPTDQMSSADAVRAYKHLANVERDFRSLKTIDLDLRPIHHNTQTRVRAHVLLCALAGYLTWHLRQALARLTFTDEHPPEPTDPVAPARRSPATDHKAATQHTVDGDQARSFRDLLDHLGTLTRNTIAVTVAGHTTRFEQLTVPTNTQRRVFELLQTPIPAQLN
jgi:transposase